MAEELPEVKEFFYQATGLLPEVEEFIASRANPKARRALEPVFKEASRYEPSTGRFEKNKQAQREMLAGMQLADSEFQGQVQNLMPYGSDPIDPSRFIAYTPPNTRSEFTLKGLYVPPGYVSQFDDTKTLDFFKRLSGGRDPRFEYFAYKDDSGVRRRAAYPLVEDSVNVFNLVPSSYATTGHEYRHRQGLGGSLDNEILNSIQDVLSAPNMSYLREELLDLNQRVFQKYDDFKGMEDFKQNRIEKVFEQEDLSSSRPKNPEAVRDLIEEMFSYSYVPKNAGEAPIPNILSKADTDKRSEKIAAEKQGRDPKKMFDRSDFKESLLFKRVMGIEEPYRFEDGTYMEEPSILQRVGEGIESLTGGRTLPEIIDQELIQRAQNVMQGPPEEKARGGPVGNNSEVEYEYGLPPFRSEVLDKAGNPVENFGTGIYPLEVLRNVISPTRYRVLEEQVTPAEELEEFLRQNPGAEQPGENFRSDKFDIVPDPRGDMLPQYRDQLMFQAKEGAFKGKPGRYQADAAGVEYIPAVRAGRAGLEFFGDLIMDPETRERAANVMKNLPRQVMEDMMKMPEVASAFQSGIGGLYDPTDQQVINTAESVLYAPVPLAIGRALSKIPEGGSTLGVFGGTKAKSFEESNKEFQRLKNEGLDDHQAFSEMERRNKSSEPYYPIFADEIEGDLKMFIPDEDASLKIKGKMLFGMRSPEFEPSGATRTFNEKDIKNISGLVIHENFGGTPGDWITIATPTQLPPSVRQNFDKRVGVPGLEAEDASTTLEQILDHPKLYQEYPELKGYRVERYMDKGEASFNPRTRTIAVRSYPNTPSGRKDFQSSLLHEVQHAIQRIEKQTGGTNPDAFKDDDHRRLEIETDKAEKDLNVIYKSMIADVLKKQEITKKMVVDEDGPSEFSPMGRISIVDLDEQDRRDFLRVAQSYIEGKVLGTQKPEDFDELTESVANTFGEEVLVLLDRYADKMAPGVKNYENLSIELARRDNEIFDLYFANPGETNSRLVELFFTGLKEYDEFDATRMPEQLADYLVQVRPDVFEKRPTSFFGKNVPFQKLKIIKDLSGPELRKLGSPDDLKPFVRGGLAPDRSQLRKNYQAGAASSIDLKGTEDSYLFSRLQYLEGTLRENLSPKNRAKADAEKTSIEMELRRRNNPESKAMGGPVGGLDVYFNQMRMM